MTDPQDRSHGPDRAKQGARLHATIWGGFRITAPGGTDLTPAGIKERALLAALILSPGQSRSRDWCVELLWPNRDPGRGATSLRRALSNIRKALGAHASEISASRSVIALCPEITLTPRPPGAECDDLLADIALDEQGWQDWLLARRAAFEAQDHAANGVDPGAPAVAGLFGADAGPASSGSMRIRLIVDPSRSHAAARFALAEDIARGLEAMGGLRAEIDETADDDPRGAALSIRLSVTEGEGQFDIGLRASGAQGRLLFALRREITVTRSPIWQQPDYHALINAVTSAVSGHLANAPGQDAAALIRRAVHRIYSYEPAGVGSADALLRQAMNGDRDTRAVALSWLGFLRLTERLEFRAESANIVDEALAFCDEAVSLRPRLAAVPALAALVRLLLSDDVDHGRFLADRAMRDDDTNPYALNAASRSLARRGLHGASFEAALKARAAAEGSFNRFAWDMQAGLSALGLGRMDEAYELIRESHRRMPAFRPALRYLVALGAALDRHEDLPADYRRLRAVESSFRPTDLLRPGYPIVTLDRLGLLQPLAGRLGALEERLS